MTTKGKAIKAYNLTEKGKKAYDALDALPEGVLDLLRVAAKATALPKFPNERISPARLAAMEDFNNALNLWLAKQEQPFGGQ